MIDMAATVTESIRLKSIYKIFFVFFVVLGLYYPSIFSRFNSIDDYHIISYLEDTDFRLLDIVLPGKSHYYRPVLWLTFFFDKYAWGLEPSFMHLENIIIHAVNAVLVYILAARIAGPDEQQLELPFLAALLFAAHPINTEAVCWVAGRTDPLATVFILAAACCLAGCGSLENAARPYVTAACIFLGCLVKELAFFFFPVACLAALWQNRTLLVRKATPLVWRELLRPALPFIFFPLAYLYLRRSALPASDKSVSILVTQKVAFIETLTAAFKAFGFYVKKLFLPLPLNFATVSYSDSYVWLGIVVAALLCWLLWQRRVYYYLLASAFFLILPAVIVAVKPIAWTPVAERYLYAPSAFFSVAFAGILYYLLGKNRYKYLLPLLLSATIIVTAFLTVQRNLIWQENYLLYKDAVAKSPQFARIRNEYGVALVEKGDNAEAFKQFEAGSKFDSKNNMPVLNLAHVRFKEGKNTEALAILASTYKEKGTAATNVLKLQAKIYEALLFNGPEKSEQKRIALELIDTYHYICEKEKNPHLVYRSGQLLLFIGEPQKAAILFERAHKEAPDDSFYKQAAGKLADKLRGRE